jgi:hypothetical protein
LCSAGTRTPQGQENELRGQGVVQFMSSGHGHALFAAEIIRDFSFFCLLLGRVWVFHHFFAILDFDSFEFAASISKHI